MNNRTKNKKSDQKEPRSSIISNLRKRIPTMLLTMIMVLTMTILGLPGAVYTASPQSLAAWEVTSDTTEINILTFNDFHGQVEPAGSNPGAARFAACMNYLKETYPNAFAVAGGDNYQGSAVSNYYLGKPVSEMMKAMGVAYSSLGNHEFDWGYNIIPQFAADGDIEFICSNLFYKGADNRPDFVKPYAIQEIDGKKIGIVGFIVTDTPVLVKAEYTEPFDFRAPGQWLTDLVDLLKNDLGCDAVIAFSHDGGAGLADYGLAGVINGHSHDYQATTVNGTAFVQAGYNGRAIGRLQLIFDNETDACNVTASYVMINSLPAELTDAGVQSRIDWYLIDSAGMFDTVIGQADISLSDQSVINDWATRLVYDFIKRQTDEPYVVIQNSGGWRNMSGLFLEKGEDITYRWLTVLMPFDNEIVLMDLSGNYLIDALNGTRAGGSGSLTTLPIIAGAYKQDSSWYLMDGTLIQSDGVYKVSCNDFMLTGGDNYDMFQYGTGVQFLGDKLRDALADEIAFRTFPGQSDVVLMTLTRTAVDASADPGNRFNADSGIFANVSNLSAWTDNIQKVIGYQGTSRTPVVFNNAAAGAWKSVGSAVEDIGVTVDTASAFQIKFETTGYKNIRFSCTQKSTGSGPESFALAYSIDNPNGPYTPIANSKHDNYRASDDTYGALQPSYINFVLPEELADQSEVYLRVYMVDSSLSNRSNGNTSINNIVIIGDEIVGGSVITPAFDAESLTLQPGTDATSINFNWYSDREDNATSVVQIARKADMVDGDFPLNGIITTTKSTVGDASSGKSWHKAGITGLDSNTQYVYRVSNNGVNFSKIYEFKTGATDSFKFAITGDPQLTVGAQDSTSSYFSTPGVTAQGWKDTMSLIEEKGVDFIAGVGDQVDLTSNGSEAEYANFFAPEQMSSIPYAPAIGNHDRHYLFNYHYNLPNEQRFAPIINADNAANQQYQEMEVAGNYYYLYNNALFVVLNDSGYPESKEVAAKYIELFDKTLKAATEAYADRYDWLFVQHHKSTASVADHLADRDIQYYVEAGFEKTMDKYGVDFVLAGHDHVYARSYPMYNGVPDKTGVSDISNNTLVQGGDGASIAVNPKGTVYFTTTSVSGLKYYELFNNAGNLYVKDNLYYPYLVDGKVGSTAYMEGNLPLSTAKYFQNKTPGFIHVTVDGNEVGFKYYDLSDEYRDTPYDTYTVYKEDAIAHIITFNPNGGTVTPASLTTGTDGKLTSLPTPTKGDDTFIGWFTALTGGDKVTTDTEFDSDAMIYALWEGGGAKEIAVEGIVLTPAVLSLKVGDTQQITAAITPADATNKTVIWSASPGGIVDVEENGLVTTVAAIKEGTVTITVTTEDGGKKAGCTVTVTAASTSTIPKGSPGGSGSIPGVGSTPPSTTTDITGSGGTPLSDQPSWFQDVNAGDWFYDNVWYVYQNNLMNGTSSSPMLFSPNAPLTRGMIVTILYRHAGSPSVSGLTNPFGDVPGGQWYTDAVIWAASNDIVLGIGDGLYAPDVNVTREQLAAIFYRYAQFPEGSTGSLDGALAFTDAASIADYARDAVLFCGNNGIITGKPGNLFDPQGNATRAEAAAMLNRVAESVASLSVVPPVDVAPQENDDGDESDDTGDMVESEE